MTEEKLTVEGYVMHPSLGEEAVWGRIGFEGWRLRFESERVRLEIPLVKLRIEREESEGGGIGLCDPDRPEWVMRV